MAIKRCVLCGHEEDDGKTFRLAIYMDDNRIAVIPAGAATIAEARLIVKNTPSAYLMMEALNVDGRIIYSKYVASSDLKIDTNGEVITS